MAITVRDAAAYALLQLECPSRRSTVTQIRSMREPHQPKEGPAQYQSPIRPTLHV